MTAVVDKQHSYKESCFFFVKKTQKVKESEEKFFEKRRFVQRPRAFYPSFLREQPSLPAVYTFTSFIMSKFILFKILAEIV